MSIDMEEVIRSAELDENAGFCIDCGSKHWNVEPDARGYKCGNCGKFTVHGAEDIILTECFK